MANLKKLFDHLQDEHGLILVDSEMQEIERIVLGTHQPFVFTDFLKELGFVFKCVNRNTFYKKNHLLIEISNVNFSVTISGHPFFKECQIPTTPEQAAFLFKSFNLLQCER